MKILIVEDDKALNKSLSESFHGVADTTSVYDGESGLFEAMNNSYDLILLDVMLPKLNGFDFLRQFRKTNSTPVLVLSALDDVDNRIKGLNLGSDDYLAKPFSRDELLARVNAIIRRYNNNFQGMTCSFKDLKINLATKTVSIGDKIVGISGKIYDMLEYLLINQNIIVSKEQLFNRIWGFESDTIYTVTEVYISNLRKKLKDYDYHIYLKTIKNVGYIWSDKVE